MRLAIYFIVLAFIVSCENNYHKEIGTGSVDSTLTVDTADLEPILELRQDIDTFYFGDLNNDGQKDTAIVFSPFCAYFTADDSYEGGCEDDSCFTNVKFSFTPFILSHSSALGFQTFFSTGDLNTDGIKEVAFIPNWFQSCWQSIFVYSLADNKWDQIGEGRVYACSDEDFSRRVSKINNHRFKIITTIWNYDLTELVDSAIVINW
jgi:hypothetical protein